MSNTPKTRLQGQEYRSLFILYSEDGKRAAEILEFQNGETYLDEQEWVEGTTFQNRHSGSLVGPFASPSDAEKFIIATPWFRRSRGMRRPIAMRGIVFGLVFIGLVALANQIWPTQQEVIGTGSVALLLFGMGAFALAKPI